MKLRKKLRQKLLLDLLPLVGNSSIDLLLDNVAKVIVKFMELTRQSLHAVKAASLEVVGCGNLLNMSVTRHNGTDCACPVDALWDSVFPAALTRGQLERVEVEDMRVVDAALERKTYNARGFVFEHPHDLFVDAHDALEARLRRCHCGYGGRWV